MTSPDGVFSVIFVCTGNICRSPMADVVFRALAARAGLADRVTSTSAGTGDWHVGEKADPRAIEALHRHGYDGEAHRARQFSATDFSDNDLIIALDRSHERILQSWAADEADAERVSLLMSFVPEAATADVPDPYYAGAAKFDEVLTMIEGAASRLFRQLEPAIRSPRTAGTARSV